MKPNMNAKDVNILTQLRENARMSLTTMSKKTGIPVSTIFDRLRIGEESIITKYTSLLNFEKLGYNARVHINLKVGKEDREIVREFLEKNEHINNIYKINNGFDYMAEGIFRNIKEAEQFVEKLESKFIIINIQNHFVLEDVKRESFMTGPLVLM